MASEIIGSYWFNGQLGNVGIVVVRDPLTKERKAYIGDATPATVEEADAEIIRESGAPVSRSVLKNIILLMEEKG
jgi:hypothetical protein